MNDQRRAELAVNLGNVNDRIARACEASGRPRTDITLTVVTKFFPASDVVLLSELGVRHIGENRHQEAEAKASACRDVPVTWHFIGGLQSNKAPAVGGYADVVESIDRLKIATGVARGAEAAGRRIDCLLQVSLDPPDANPDRAGIAPSELGRLAEQVAQMDALTLRGLMAVAPLGVEPRQAFTHLQEIANRLRQDHPDATWVSAGMSGDLEVAIEHGATHVRIGRSVLGERPLIK